MQSIRTFVLGAMVVVAAFAVSALNDGAIGAASLILGLFLALAATGLAAAAAVDRWLDSPVVNPVLAAQTASARCSTCGGPRESLSGLWICKRCDWSTR